MKKVLFLLVMIAAFAGCSKDDDKEVVSTFSITNNSEKFESPNDKYLNGSLYEVVVFEYDENGDNIGQKNVANVAYGGGLSEKVQVSATCVKIQVSFKMLPKESPNYDLSTNKRQYIKSLGVIKKGDNINIVMDGETMITTSPSLGSKSVSTELRTRTVFDNINLEIK